MSSYRRARLTISKGVLRDNIEAVRRATRGTRLLAVIKADAYGHGLLTAAKVFAPYCYGFAVATIDEAVRLREAGFSLPVLVLGGTPESAAAEAVVYPGGNYVGIRGSPRRAATVAFVLENGRAGMPANPWNRRASAKSRKRVNEIVKEALQDDA